MEEGEGAGVFPYMHWAVAAATNHQGYPFVNGGTTLGPPMAGCFMLFLASVIRSPCLPAVGRPWWDLDGLDGRTGRIWDVGMFYIPTHCIGIRPYGIPQQLPSRPLNLPPTLPFLSCFDPECQKNEKAKK